MLGTVTQVLVGMERGVKMPVAQAALGWQGLAGDRHATATRWAQRWEKALPTGREVRNLRQVSLVSDEELATTAAAMGVERLEAAWLAANVVVRGIPDFSQIAPGSYLLFEGGAGLLVTAANRPCRVPMQYIHDHLPEEQRDRARLFAKAALGRRGLLALVLMPGMIAVDEQVRVVPPEET